MEVKKKTYKKYDSFETIIFNDDLDHLSILDDVNKKLRNYDKKKFSNFENKILENITKDLSEKEEKKGKFKLSGYVLRELQTLEDKDTLDYLIHRYRYEIFPQLNKLHDFPPYLQIEPSSICNYRCVFCYQTDNFFNKKSQGHMGKMNYEMFKNIVDQAVGNVQFLSLASRGEPLLCPDIYNMLDYTRDKFYNLKINTNAYNLDEKLAHTILKSGVKTLVFSVDAADKKLYEKLRVHGKFEKVFNNIKQFIEIKNKHYSKSKIITRVSGVKVSDDQKMEEMTKVWSGLVDQIAFVNFIPWVDTYNDEVNDIKAPCSDLWRRMFVWWNGETNPCDYDYKSELKLDNILDNNIKNVWNSEKYNELRVAHIKKNRKKIFPCDRCKTV
jgi:radical SAM protein with 4Fe4S-binding SPASM domain